MSVQFTVLGSGSSGNASLLEVDGFGLLLDAGLGPRRLGAQLGAVGASWGHVHAALLTHTHTDHWSDRTFAHLRRRRIPLYCHASHHEALLTGGWEFAKLQGGLLVHSYESEGDFAVAPGFRCRPLRLRHDSGATFGFRFEGQGALYDPPWAMAYVADLGSWTPELAQALTDVDLLALEFNHDVEMEYSSGRSHRLIARVLGENGHLSNEQAGALLTEVLRCSQPGRLRHVVQLHLSRQCNHLSLAAQAARTALAGHEGVELHTACQDKPTSRVSVWHSPERNGNGKPAPRQRVRPPASSRTAAGGQPWLPGWEA